MKKNVKLIALAVAALSFAVACNNNKPANEDSIIDTTAVEDLMMIEPVDSLETVAEPVAEEPVKKATTQKKADNEPVKTVEKTDSKTGNAEGFARQKNNGTNEAKVGGKAADNNTNSEPAKGSAEGFKRQARK
jgi:hypothetical protein